MDLYEMFNDIVSAVATDEELSAWSMANYGQKHKVFIDQDQRYPPGESDAPDIQFHSPSKSADELNRIVDYGIGVFIVIYDPSETTRAEINIDEFSGSKKTMEFLDRVLKVIRSAKPEGFYMSYDYLIDTIESFPNFEVDVGINLRQTLLIGEDPLG